MRSHGVADRAVIIADVSTIFQSKRSDVCAGSWIGVVRDVPRHGSRWIGEYFGRQQYTDYRASRLDQRRRGAERITSDDPSSSSVRR